MPAEDRLSLRFWISVSVLSLSVFMTVLDTTLLTVSTPTLVRDFHTTIRSLQWVFSAYSLALVPMLITGGRFGDLWGRKKILLLGGLVFAAGSLVSSFAMSVPMLIMGEAIEGLGAACMAPATAALIVSNFQGRARALAFGLYVGFASIGSIVGPMLGGYFTTFYSWRWGFRINLFMVAVLFLGSRFIRESRDLEERREFDVTGILLCAAGIFAITFGVIESSVYGWWYSREPSSFFGAALAWLSVTPVSIAAGAALLVAFLVWEHYRVQHNRTPLISPRIFKNWQFSSGLLITLLIYLGVIGFSFLASLAIQLSFGLSAFATALTILPSALCTFIFSQISAYLARYIRPRTLIQGGLLLGIAGLIVTNQAFAAGLPYNLFLLGMILYGMGVGLTFAQFTNLTLSAVSANESGEASGLYNTVRYASVLFGIAMTGSIFLAGIASRLNASIVQSAIIPLTDKPAIETWVAANLPAFEAGVRPSAAGQITPSQASEVELYIGPSILQAAKDTLLYNIGYLILALLLSFTLTRSRNLELDRSPALQEHARGRSSEVVGIAQ